MNHTIIDCTPQELEACRLFLACIRDRRHTHIEYDGADSAIYLYARGFGSHALTEIDMQRESIKDLRAATAQMEARPGAAS